MEYNRIVTIIFSLMIGLALVPSIASIESHTIWFHNKMWPGTVAGVDVYSARTGENLDIGAGSTAHDGFNIVMSIDYTDDYYLVFSVAGSFQQEKTRGNFKPDRDYEWKFTGSVDDWDIEQLR
uniref:tRNA (Mo5U34)-methyltransferase n=1 Tax=Anthurium amnicola TaxID=1678845 RepID=A0A1D1Y1Y9_9ARAE